MTENVAKLLGVSNDTHKDALVVYKDFLDSLDMTTMEKVVLTKNIAGLTRRCVNEKRRLIIVRGIPGSGKSTFAKQIKLVFKIIHIDCEIQEADMYMGTPFEPSKLRSCHEECQKQTKAALANEKFVIVSNTSTLKSEVTPYLRIAKEAKTQTLTIEPPTSWNRDALMCQEKCTKKGIPKHIFQKYLDNLVQNK